MKNFINFNLNKVRSSIINQEFLNFKKNYNFTINQIKKKDYTFNKYKINFFIYIAFFFTITYYVFSSPVPGCGSDKILKQFINNLKNNTYLAKKEAAAAVGSLKTMGFSLLLGKDKVPDGYEDWVRSEIKFSFKNIKKNKIHNGYSCSAKLYFEHSNDEFLLIPYEPGNEAFLSLAKIGMMFGQGRTEMTKLKQQLNKMRDEFKSQGKIKYHYTDIQYEISENKNSKQGYRLNYSTEDLKKKDLVEFFSSFVMLRYLNTF